MFEEGVSGMIGAERRSQGGDPDAWSLALGVDERKHFVRHIGVVLRLHPAAMVGMRALILKRLTIHAVDTKDSDASLLDVRAERSNHALPFHLPFVAHARREGEDRRAVVAVNGDAHVSVKPVRVPTLMVTMHGCEDNVLRVGLKLPLNVDRPRSAPEFRLHPVRQKVSIALPLDMIFRNTILAQAQSAANQAEIVWPWFIVGCVLLLVAVVAFFWAFALGKLTEGQHFLLMWILPLSSGFAVGCFAGSLKATGPIGAVTATATGGFAVWLLSYFLLPKPSKIAPDSVSANLPAMSFRQASKFLADLDGYSASFTGLDDTILNAQIKSGQMTAAGVRELIEQLRYRFVGDTIQIEYRVVRDSSRGLYEITTLERHTTAYLLI